MTIYFPKGPQIFTEDFFLKGVTKALFTDCKLCAGKPQRHCGFNRPLQ